LSKIDFPPGRGRFHEEPGHWPRGLPDWFHYIRRVKRVAVVFSANGASYVGYRPDLKSLRREDFRSGFQPSTSLWAP